VGPLSSLAYRLSTEAFPERERIAFWREEFGRVILKLDVDPIGSKQFHCDVTLRAIPGLSLFSGQTSSVHYRAPPSLAASNDDSIGIMKMVRNTAVAVHMGRESTLTTGDATLLSCTDPLLFSVPTGGYSSAVRLSRPMLQALVPGLNDAYNRVIPEQNGALKLLFGYLKVLQEQDAAAAPALQHVVVTHIYDLAALALGASRDVAEVAKERGLRAARLRAVKEDITARLAEPDLSLESVALRHRVSPRYIQKLFEQEGTSFSDYVRGGRLALTYRMLQDPRLAHQNISTIAYDCGFGDITAFNRAFRRHFSASPSDVRHSFKPH
jgi:AraC-like DNA-binding protein